MTVGGALLHTTITLLLLCLGVSLSIHGLSQARPSQHFSSSEVMIPLKVTSAKAPGWLSYRMRIGGQRYVVHMKVKKLLISTHLPVFTYTEQHGLQEDHPFVPVDCYYHGYVQQTVRSLVALSACYGGFQGMLQINDLMYEIEPIRHSKAFEHLIHHIGSDETESPHMRCGLTEEAIARQLELQSSYISTLKQRSYVPWWTHHRIVELGVLVDNDRFVYSNRNVTLVQTEVFHVVNIVDTLYHPISVDVILTGVEIWNVMNQIETKDDLDNVLQRFAVWKHMSFDPRLWRDTVHLFIKQLHGEKVGAAYVKGICRSPFNSGVDVFEDRNFTRFALTLTHELGHNLGMQHDEKWCVCEQQFCIMNAERKNSTQFSNCSYGQFFDNTLDTGGCIFTPANPRRIIRLRFCGNRVVDNEEECDCGSIQECTQDPCCMLNCTRKPGAACVSGSCCEDCKFMPPGTLCREQVNQCDLPEWCNGTSHECPDDVFVKDGISCSDNSYCFDKMCNNHDTQCKEIFGQEARGASDSCYQELNSQGTRFGHCHIDETTYIKCSPRNVRCGRIQCENVHQIPELKEHITVHQFHFNNTTCWSTDYHLGMSIPDIGRVKDGTVCGPEKICIGKVCIGTGILRGYCKPQDCNMHGICNNRQHCHCHFGWAPPNCTLQGNGGSVDSGPAPEKAVEELPVPIKRKLSLLSLLLLIPLIYLCIICYFLLCRGEKEKKEKEEEGSEETETETEDE
ncbi:disintegrin and metalloproteinase domain-containing protein 20 [Oryctolagus cuniculus]|uniref:disintegrin and metalloproteinase domain-containing protein 20 n=1 Tax=Oryctolagus cuniculus TaxID=9986 RepID=UPI00048D2373|nr:disintegrin and metalloproteinase domain-containing protein 20 [Oryctolagus cuniculus]